MAKLNESRSLEEMLRTPIDEIEPPKLLPPGHYICVVQGPPNYGKIESTGTKTAVFPLKPIMAEEDVDEDILKEQGGIGDRMLYHTLYMTDNALIRVKNFLEDCGVEYDKSDKKKGIKGASLDEGIAAVVGHQVRVKVVHNPSKDQK